MRDENGRFVKGHSGNPAGRKPKVKELSYLDIVTEVVTREEFRAGVEKQWAKAKRGDLHAMRFITEYILGKPTQDVSVESYIEQLPQIVFRGVGITEYEEREQD